VPLAHHPHGIPPQALGYPGTRIGEVGALLLALKGPDGAFHFAGKVGTGFTSAMRARFGKLLEAGHVDEPLVVDAPRMKAARWSRLKLVAEVEFIKWTVLVQRR
jgi:bifunctional non-homologous end joining protein LigD